MGVGGHILGPRKLRRLNRLAGIEFHRAAIRNHHCEAIVWHETSDDHYEVDLVTGKTALIADAGHWTSCYDRLTGREGR